MEGGEGRGGSTSEFQPGYSWEVVVVVALLNGGRGRGRMWDRAFMSDFAKKLD